MPRKYKQDEVINGYTIDRDGFHNSGAMALSYAAQDKSGAKVFFKQYKSPTLRVSWYRDYVAYQKELKKRVDNDPILNQFCYEMLDFFEHKKNYHQVFEWVDASQDLSKILEAVSSGGGPDFDQRVILAKQLMSRISVLHDADIVHADLKPENLQLIKDTTITAGHKLVLIDMDFSVLSDKKAPWHDDPETGYVGSPNFYSPEHLTGNVPLESSDVFTCSLILHELLGAGHPYESDDIEEYKDKVLNLRAQKPKLEGTIKDAETTDRVAEYLHHCLNPDPTQRPSAKDVRDALNGKASPLSAIEPGTPPASKPRPPTETPSEPESSPVPVPEPEPEPESVSSLTLEGPDGGEISLRIKTIIGKSIVRQFGDDSQFWSEPQFSLERLGKCWTVTHDPNAANETLVNGKAVTETESLKDGDVLSVGRESKGIVKLPLTVRVS